MWSIGSQQQELSSMHFTMLLTSVLPEIPEMEHLLRSDEHLGAIDRAASMQRCESACTEMHRVVISRIESSLFSVRSASLFTMLSCRLFRYIYSTLRVSDLCKPINTLNFVNSQQHL